MAVYLARLLCLHRLSHCPREAAHPGGNALSQQYRKASETVTAPCKAAHARRSSSPTCTSPHPVPSGIQISCLSPTHQSCSTDCPSQVPRVGSCNNSVQVLAHTRRHAHSHMLARTRAHTRARARTGARIHMDA